LREREEKKKNSIEINWKRLRDRSVGKADLIALEAQDLRETGKWRV